MTARFARSALVPLLVAALGLLAGIPAAIAQSVEAEWAADLATEARSASPAQAFAALVELGAVLDWVAPADAQDVWESLATDLDDATPAAWARYSALRFARQRGDDGAADALEQALGFVGEIALIGPFPNDGMQGLAETFGPELDGFLPGASYAGRLGDVSWRTVAGPSETGYHELSDAIQPAHNVAVYVAFEVPARRSGRVVLDLAVDGAYRLWLNGDPVAEQRSHLGGALLRDAHELRLRQGNNVVVLKVAVADGPFGFHARLVDAGGVTAGRPRAPTHGTSALRGSDAWTAAPTALDRLPVVGESADELAARALVLRTLQPEDPTEPWVGLAERVARADDATPTALLRAALATREHWRKVELLERAREAGGRAELAWALAHLEELGIAPIEQVRAASTTMTTVPGALRLQFARVARDIGFTHVWAAEVDALLQEYGPVRALLPEAIAVARDLSRGESETELLRLRWASDRLDAVVLADWLDRLRLLGRVEEAGAVVADAEARSGRKRGVRLVLAQHLAATGAGEAAIAQLDTLLAQSPDDVDARLERGRLLVRLGRDAEAIADAEQALARRRQDEGARLLLAALRPGVDAGHVRWRVPLDELVATAAALQPAEGTDTTVLVDQRVVEVHPNGLASRWTQQAYVAHTRSAADELGTLGISYSPASEVVEILGVQVVAGDGTIRTSYEQADYGPPPGPAAMYFDVHTRALRLPAIAPGDVVVYEYRVSDVAERNIFDDYFGDIFVVQGDDPVVLSRYVVSMPAGRTLQTQTVNGVHGSWSVETAPNGGTTYVHEARDVTRLSHESNLAGWSETRQWLSVSTYSSWDTLARWYWTLIERQLVVTPPIRAVVDELVEGLDSDEEIVQTIHEYVVRNIRYVGLEFGVHGYKPYRTSEIFERRFGDCKDSASLIKVMLDAAGVPAHLVLIRTRDQGRVPAQPPSLAVFNHAIVWVPSLDLYLDGTAGFSGFREVPSMDQGASALHVLDGEGGTFVETPFVASSANVDRTLATIDLRGGAPSGTLTMELVGGYAAGARAQWEAEEGRDAAIERGLAQRVAGIELSVDSVTGVGNIREPVRVAGTFSGGEWVRRSSGSMRIPVSPGRSSMVAMFAPSSARTRPVALPSPSTLHERFEWILPDGCTAELPAPIELPSPFGLLRVVSSGTPNAPVLETHMQLDAARVDVSDYEAFRSWLTRIDTELNRELGVDCAGQVHP